MTPQEFCYWLQGFFEMQQPTKLSAAQTQQVKDHLALVFEKVTPAQPDVQALLKESVERSVRTVSDALRRGRLPIARDHTHLENVKFC